MRDVAAWLEARGYRVVQRVRDGTRFMGRREGAARFNSVGRLLDPQEVAVVVVDGDSLRTSVAQGHINAAARWRARTPRRWVSIVVPPDLTEADLVVLRGVDQVVRLDQMAVYPRPNTTCGVLT